jgi:hypothetical protein
MNRFIQNGRTSPKRMGRAPMSGGTHAPEIPARPRRGGRVHRHGRARRGLARAIFDNVSVTAPDGTMLLADDFPGDLSQWNAPPSGIKSKFFTSTSCGGQPSFNPYAGGQAATSTDGGQSFSAQSAIDLKFVTVVGA